VFSARIWNATSSSGITSATMLLAPSSRDAPSRWFPFGVQYTPSCRTAISGSRYRSTRSIALASRFTCVSDRSRWYGVGSTLPMGSAASTTVCPPSGSRYTASACPPSSEMSCASFSPSAGRCAATSAGDSPLLPASTFLRRGRRAGFF